MSAPKYEQDPVLFKIILLVGIVALAFVVMLWALDLVEVSGQEELPCISSSSNNVTVVKLKVWDPVIALIVRCDDYEYTIAHYLRNGYDIVLTTESEVFMRR